MKRIVTVVITLSIAIMANAATYTSSGSGTWLSVFGVNPTNSSTDNFYIEPGHNVTVTGNYLYGNVTVKTGGSLTINGNMDISPTGGNGNIIVQTGATLDVNGTVNSDHPLSFFTNQGTMTAENVTWKKLRFINQGKLNVTNYLRLASSECELVNYDTIYCDIFEVDGGSISVSQPNAIALIECRQMSLANFTGGIDPEDGFNLAGGTINVTQDFNPNPYTNYFGVTSTGNYNLTTTIMYIAPNTTLNVLGDFKVAGATNMRVDGELNIGGELAWYSIDSLCGDGVITYGYFAPGLDPDPTSTDPAEIDALNALLCGSFILPVDLLYFKSTMQDAQVKLIWTTVSEKDFNYFVIERSSDGVNYEEINLVKAEGNGGFTRYSIMDANPLPAKSYYKLIGVDLDGTSEDLEIIAIDQFGIGDVLYVFPNPSEGGDVNVFVNEVIEEGSYELSDMSGSLVQEDSLKTGDNKIKFLVEPGVYILKARIGTRIYTSKVVVN